MTDTTETTETECVECASTNTWCAACVNGATEWAAEMGLSEDLADVLGALS